MEEQHLFIIEIKLPSNGTLSTLLLRIKQAMESCSTDIGSL